MWASMAKITRIVNLPKYWEKTGHTPVDAEAYFMPGLVGPLAIQE